MNINGIVVLCPLEGGGRLWQYYFFIDRTEFMCRRFYKTEKAATRAMQKRIRFLMVRELPK
jgi:hypothetical protein